MAYAYKEFWSFVLGSFMTTIGQGAALAAPMFVGKGVDAMTCKDYSSINWLVLYYMVIVVVSSFASAWNTYIFFSMSERIALNLRNDYYVSIINKDIAFFDERKSGDLLSRLSSDIKII